MSSVIVMQLMEQSIRAEIRMPGQRTKCGCGEITVGRHEQKRNEASEAREIQRIINPRCSFLTYIQVL